MRSGALLFTSGKVSLSLSPRFVVGRALGPYVRIIVGLRHAAATIDAPDWLQARPHGPVTPFCLSIKSRVWQMSREKINVSAHCLLARSATRLAARALSVFGARSAGGKVPHTL